MNNFEPFDYVLAFSIIGTSVSLIPEINELMRFIILLFTCIGIIVKTIEQILDSTSLRDFIKKLWIKLNKRK